MPLPRGLTRGRRLRDAILAYQPTAYWPLDDGNGPLRDVARNWNATVTGSPLYRQALQGIERGITWSGSSQRATTSASLPTPTASLSVVSLMSTTDATAAARYIVSRAAASQWSWGLNISSASAAQFIAFQSGASAHATAAVAGTVNDGTPYLLVGTFDGTTISLHRMSSTGAYTLGTSTSLTGTWHTASTAAVQLAAANSGNHWVGTTTQTWVINDRVLTAADARYLASIVFGG